MSQAAEIVSRARALIGTPFCPQGRRAEDGLDCIGLAAIAGAIPVAAVPTGYRLRSAVPDALLSEGLRPYLRPIEAGEAAAGDAIVVKSGPGQHHVLILVPGGFVHADFGIGRVVETPGEIAWPILSVWRFLQAED